MKKGIKIILMLLFVSGSINFLSAQKKEYNVACVAFYNIENLFDTIDTPDVSDSEFTPEGKKVWNSEKYYKKLNNIAEVISNIGDENVEGGPYVMGLSEIENRQVIEDLINMPQLKASNYGIVHYDSPDRRGVDVALIYRKDFFTVTRSQSYELTVDESLYVKRDSTGDDDGTFRSRDQLMVTGNIDGEEFHFIVNHWPSRSGGEKRSRPLRNAAAELTKSIADSIYKTDANAKIIIMGDLNDNPNNDSMKKILDAKLKKEDVQVNGLYNPMYKKFKKGIGTGAYRDSWSLFDNLIVSKPLLGDDKSSYMYLSAHIYNRPFLIQKTGNFEGYPFRTFVGDSFKGGYSDHFPVYLFLIKDK